MGQVINTNVLSLNAQRSLARTQGDLAQALQRLSSGLRINSAKDDAAGLAITERFTTQIRGLNQAVRNANDGISLSQTAESALGELGNNLQRIRELAVQSANSTNSASDREALNLEVEQRLAEIERIATQTAFNGLKVLDGTFGTSQFQVGANAGETISINLSQGVRTSQIGSIVNVEGTAVTGNALTDGGLTIQVGSGTAVSVGASADGDEAGQSDESAFAKAAAINAAGITGLTATASTEVTTTLAATGGSATDTYALSVNGIDIFAAGSDASTAITAQAIVDAVNLESATTGVTAELDAGDVTFTAADGRDIVLAQTIVGGGGGLGAAATTRGNVTLQAGDELTLTGQFADIGHAASLSVSGSLTTVDVSTVDGANDAMLRMDAALTSVSTLRSTFGAIQNRFESTIANLTAVSESLSASRSRIQDADFAAETAALTRAQILQQAGTAILAQANAAPQTVLALLQ
jgi:flagellin